MDTLTASEAADFLGVKTSTLYAYVSRGLIESIRSPDDPRARRYRKRDLVRLKRRSDAHAGGGAAAAGALDWGAPSLETRISQITPSGPRYRGELATKLAEGERCFEEIAEFLWTGDWPAQVSWPTVESTLPTLGDVATDSRMIERLRLTIARAGLHDLGRFADTLDGRLRCARRIYSEVLAAIGREVRGDLDARSGVVDSLIHTYELTDRDAVRAAVRMALVLIADHEMNASTFAARVTASTGADLYACVEGALTALSGPRHGGSADRCEALLQDIARHDSVHVTLLGRVQRGGSTPGFGHPLYPDGDPRFRKLCTALPDISAEHLALAAELEEEAEALELGAPTIDLGLAILADALGIAPSGASTLFAVGRIAGWIAHAIEQYDQGHLLRPRARYVGD
jgi:citrate synthase